MPGDKKRLGRTPRVAGKRMKSAGKTKKNNKTPPIVDVTDEGDAFYAIVKVHDRRSNPKTGKVEYLVEWEGDGYENTWEPDENLCDSALEEYHKNREVDSARKLGLDGGSSHDTDDTNHSKNIPDEDDAVDKELEAVLVTESDTSLEKVVGVIDATDTAEELQSENKLRDHDSNGDCDDSDALGGDQKPAAAKVPKNVFVDDTHFDWSDAGHVLFQSIERISVHDPEAGKKVTTARTHGTPVVLTGHKGWPQFANKWLSPVDDSVLMSDREQSQQNDSKSCDCSDGVMYKGDVLTNDNIEKEMLSEMMIRLCPKRSTFAVQEASKVSSNGCEAENLLDLSKPHKVDVAKMTEDIGNELVPILRKHYKESDPIKENLSISRFLQNCWPNDLVASNKSTTSKTKVSFLYLHQWLFTASETAVPKLCNKVNPLPDTILGEDLLTYWCDYERCAGDSPYQYLFMGNTGTMSKLHKDNGGLLISIAPIVGQKEVVLVHRADGSSSLYHLTASLDKPDLHKFPLLYSARIWRSIIQPGEILLMPHGTYHQCRNVTPCLSYHRFHLDTVNLKAFFESWRDKDAPELEHEDVIWNAASGLMKIIDDWVKKFRTLDGDLTSDSVQSKVLSAVKLLRVLHKICREMTIRFEEESLSKMKSWNQLVGDIEASLHDFRFRKCEIIPKLVRRFKSGAEVQKQQAISLKEEDGVHINSSNEMHISLANLVKALPRLTHCETAKIIPDNILLSIGDIVAIKLHGRRAVGKITSIKDQMTAAMVHYKNFSEFDDELLPLNSLRVQVGGSLSEININRLQPGMTIIALDQDNHYPAEVKFWCQATCYQIALLTQGDVLFHQWTTRKSIIERVT
jgi:Cupin-like domain/Chromo (CHRromatin Organisation MOdifier) domain